MFMLQVDQIMIVTCFCLGLISSSIFIFLNFGMNSWITTSGGVARLVKETGLDSGGIDTLEE